MKKEGKRERFKFVLDDIKLFENSQERAYFEEVISWTETPQKSSESKPQENYTNEIRSSYTSKKAR